MNRCKVCRTCWAPLRGRKDQFWFRKNKAPFAVEFDVQVGDVAEMRKPHPCGGTRWQVYRIGADIGLRCLTCGRRLLLPRSAFNKAARRLVKAAHTQGDDER